jgi:hypothetical protein
MTEEMAFDVASRRLCPDGACTGIIGPDGKCSECGQAPSASALGATDAPVNESSATANEARFLADEGRDAAEGTFDANRPLCPDGSCVGVLGIDGRCGVCGKLGRVS